MVQATLRTVDPHVSFTAVHASRGKIIRAEPVAALYEQRKVHHVGSLSVLEDQLCGFTSDFDRSRAGYSPDRLDALVWALSDLMVKLWAADGLAVAPIIVTSPRLAGYEISAEHATSAATYMQSFRY
jgi:phage terminase large subunit-like protein